MSKLRTADDVELNQKLIHSYGHGETLAQQLSQFPEAKQQLLADILSLPCLQDEAVNRPSPDFLIGQTDAEILNDFRSEVRQALQDYFMGGDVGVDMGASEEPTLQEQVGGKQVDKSSSGANHE